MYVCMHILSSICVCMYVCLYIYIPPIIFTIDLVIYKCILFVVGGFDFLLLVVVFLGGFVVVLLLFFLEGVVFLGVGCFWGAGGLVCVFLFVVVVSCLFCFVFSVVVFGVFFTSNMESFMCVYLTQNKRPQAKKKIDNLIYRKINIAHWLHSSNFILAGQLGSALFVSRANQ